MTPAAQVQTRFARVAVMDDGWASRETLKRELAELGIAPQEMRGPYRTIRGAFTAMKGKQSLAAVCDHQLSPRNYAAFYGAELVAYCNERSFPALLITKYSKEDIVTIRPYRDRIPVVLNPNELDPKELAEGLAACADEVVEGRIGPTRKPWRTLVNIEEVDRIQRIVWATIPAWIPPGGEEGIRFPLNMVPPGIQTKISAGARIFARVNIGAEKHDDLFLTKFELPDD